MPTRVKNKELKPTDQTSAPNQQLKHATIAKTIQKSRRADLNSTPRQKPRQ